MTSSLQYVVGVDVGGTFTDILAYNPADHSLLSAKVPSMPGEQWNGVLDALASLAIEPRAIRTFVHGTTIATNALLERKGAPTALVTTKGFRDVLEIGKGRRLVGGLFEANWQRPAPIVPRELRFEVRERTRADGTTQTEVEEADFKDIVEALRSRGIRSVAVAFINSYVNDTNEKRAAWLLQEAMPDVAVSQSAALAPERGEYERTSTAVLNAYLTPTIVHYLQTLGGALRSRGVSAGVNIMGSNGGAMTLAEATKRVAGTFLSGPVGGVCGAARVAEMAGQRNIITFDMGGTSTDVALIRDLSPRMSYDNRIDAYPLQMPQLDIHAIGAGGGSLIWIGADGTLQIGPRSAGAVPGPACYGRGGTEPTISDANLLLGRLPTQRPLSGGLMLDKAAAERAFQTVASQLKTTDLVALADGALSIAVAKMAGAVREVSVHRGHDPRDFVLVGFGGAGPMHIFLVAEELGVPRVVIPRFPGHLCALGQMLADIRRDSVLVWGGPLSRIKIEELQQRAKAMLETAERLLESDGVKPAKREHSFTLDMRYVGQSFTMPIEWDPAAKDWSAVRKAFDARHNETFGYAASDNDAEFVNVRLVSVGLVEKPKLTFKVDPGVNMKIETGRVFFGAWLDCPVYNRNAMEPGLRLEGPAVIEEAGGTTVVPPGWVIEVHESGSLVGTSSSQDTGRAISPVT
jgi:N-methylhydantoinase A